MKDNRTRELKPVDKETVEELARAVKALAERQVKLESALKDLGTLIKNLQIIVTQLTPQTPTPPYVPYDPPPYVPYDPLRDWPHMTRPWGTTCGETKNA